MSYLTMQALKNIKSEISPVDYDRSFWKLRQIHREWGQSPLPDDMANQLESLRSRVSLRKRIAESSVDGYLYLHVWQMDCDCASGTSRHKIKATFDAYIKFVDELYEYAEGPVKINFMTKEEYDDFKPRSVDHALEAYENGHPGYVPYFTY